MNLYDEITDLKNDLKELNGIFKLYPNEDDSIIRTFYDLSKAAGLAENRINKAVYKLDKIQCHLNDIRVTEIRENLKKNRPDENE